MTQETDALVASADDHKFTLRLPEGIHEALESTRMRENRSLNTEILMRIQRTIEEDEKQATQRERTHLGLIEFLAGCVQELAAMLPEEQRSDTKVQLMVELTEKFVQAK